MMPVLSNAGKTPPVGKRKKTTVGEFFGWFFSVYERHENRYQISVVELKGCIVNPDET